MAKYVVVIEHVVSAFAKVEVEASSVTEAEQRAQELGEDALRGGAGGFWRTSLDYVRVSEVVTPDGEIIS